MATVAAAVSEDDLDFLRRFEDCGVREEEWTHEAHVRIAWTVLSLDDFPVACERLRRGILRHNTSVLGRPGQYHETVTVAFASVIAERMQPGEKWSGFRRRIADILSRDRPILHQYYSAERLDSNEARSSFVEPDIRPLPASSGLPAVVVG